MGIDVFGIKPKSKAGEYFRANVWHWRPLADCIMTVARDTASPCKDWHSNDGDGLNAKQSVELVRILRDEVASGRGAKYVHRHNAILASMPDEKCPICEGTDKTPWEARTEYFVARDLTKIRPCGHCKSTGRARPWATLYHLEVRNIEEFASFLNDCRGFVIC